MSSKQSSTTMLTAVVLAASLGLGAGFFANRHEGFSGAQNVMQEISASTLDSSVLPIAGSPAHGGVNAAATIVVFTDLQCEASRGVYTKFYDSVSKLHGNDVRIVYKAFPLSSHQNATIAAQAAAAANLQNKFWPFFDAITKAAKTDPNNPDLLSENNLQKFANDANLDLAKFNADLNSPEVLNAVRKDIDLGKKFNLSGTPGVFVNGKQIQFKNGVSEDEFVAAVNQEVARINTTLGKANAKYLIAQLLNGDQPVAAAPSYASTTTDLGRSVKGNPNALVTIVEFSDYQCPFCSKAEPTIAQLLKDYPNDIRVVFTHNPLSFHNQAKLAAQAAYAAGLQNKFWEMHDLLFANQKTLGRDNLLRFAQDLGLNMDKFTKDLESPETIAVIDSNIEEASKKGFSGTPAFLINSKSITGAQPIDNFKRIIDEELSKARDLSQKSGLKGDALYTEIMKDFKPAPKRGDRPRGPQIPEGKILVELGDAPVLGDANAPVTIVEFTDFQCPFCSRASKTLDELLENPVNEGKIKIVFKHNPLSFHNQAKLAHQAAEAAKLQDKFWPYYHMLFENQKALDRDNLIAYAETLGLDKDKFIADMDSQAVIDRVEADLKQGSDVKVQGTPHFFINGTRFSGARPADQFQAAIDKELTIVDKYKDQDLNADALYRKIIEDGKIIQPPRRMRPDRRPLKDGAPLNLEGIDPTKIHRLEKPIPVNPPADRLAPADRPSDAPVNLPF